MRKLNKLNKLIISVIGGFALLMPNTALRAQTFPKVYVFGESDDADNFSCSETHKSTVATVQAALRSNNIEIEYDTDAYSYMAAYVNLTVVKPSNICVVNWSLILQNYQYIEDEFLQKSLFLKVVYCDIGGIFTGSASEVYSDLLLAMKDATNQCVSKYYEKIKE